MLLGLLTQSQDQWFSGKAADAAIDEAAVEERVAARLSLLRAKNFPEADRIREELSGRGIQLMDYKDPETGERRTKWEVKR